MAKTPSIADLQAMDDAALSSVLGLDQKLADAKEGLQALASLEGKARTEAEDRIQKMLQPHVYPEEFKWIAESAKRHAKKKQTGEEALGCACEPMDVF